MTKILLNMIVKNEAACIERCLASVVDQICGAVIVDTGSEDATRNRIVQWTFAHNIPAMIGLDNFHDFSQARNAALDAANGPDRNPADFDYILLMDADMELVGTIPDDLTANAYQIEQRGGGLSYWNTRLLKRGVPAKYVGVTHEYLSVEGVEKLHGCYFIDHMDGANRPGKLDRDVALLRAEIQRNPDDHRSRYYLAQSLRDLGQHVEAASHYHARAAAGGWDEEAWSAKLNEARCYLAAGKKEAFVDAALLACDMRPSRAEPLYDLAKHYRMAGKNHLAAMFARAGMLTPKPDDLLFVESDVYDSGLKEEFSIAGYYTIYRDMAGGQCQWLATAKTVPAERRETARRNLAFYAQPLPSLATMELSTKRIEIDLPPGWNAHNPGLARQGGLVTVNVRGGNYTLHPDGSFTAPPGDNVKTRNWLANVRTDLTITNPVEIEKPADWPEPLNERVQGFEDCRLFWWKDQLHVSATMMERTPEGWCEIALARVGPGPRLTEWRIMETEGPRRNEKNWMPVVLDYGHLQFLYSVDPPCVVNYGGNKIHRMPVDPDFSLDHLRGGSPLLAFDGGWLAATHEVVQNGNMRNYLHRWVWWDVDMVVRKISDAFVVHSANDYEYIGGLVKSPFAEDTLLFCFGKWCREAWLGTISERIVRNMLHD